MSSSQNSPCSKITTATGLFPLHPLSRLHYFDTNFLLLPRNQIPRQTWATLEGHVDEVWHIEFSHNGKFLASASKDTTVIIWSVEVSLNLVYFFKFLGCSLNITSNDQQQRNAIHILTDHEEAVSYLSWSPDDSQLLSCGRDKKVKLWDTKAIPPSFLSRCLRCAVQQRSVFSDDLVRNAH